MKKLTLFLISVSLILGCGKKVLVPPKIDLNTYNKIGLINFSSKTKGKLTAFVTQKFMEEIQHSQPGTPIVELGNEEMVLDRINHKNLDLDAIIAIGDHFQLDAIITGNLEVTNIQPKINLNTFLTAMSVEAEVNASLSAKLIETIDAATLWSNSVQGKKTVGNITLSPGGVAIFDAQNPEQAYGELAHWLVVRVTEDFRPRYVRE
jgi:hypothetical protein